MRRRPHDGNDSGGTNTPIEWLSFSLTWCRCDESDFFGFSRSEVYLHRIKKAESEVCVVYYKSKARVKESI